MVKQLKENAANTAPKFDSSIGRDALKALYYGGQAYPLAIYAMVLAIESSAVDYKQHLRNLQSEENTKDAKSDWLKMVYSKIFGIAGKPTDSEAVLIGNCIPVSIYLAERGALDAIHMEGKGVTRKVYIPTPVCFNTEDFTAIQAKATLAKVEILPELTIGGEDICKASNPGGSGVAATKLVQLAKSALGIVVKGRKVKAKAGVEGEGETPEGILETMITEYELDANTALTTLLAEISTAIGARLASGDIAGAPKELQQKVDEVASILSEYSKALHRFNKSTETKKAA